jgi:predicted RNA-binding Zn ribbon-like protein
MVRRAPAVPFLWIGNHPATDLCNTRPVIGGDPVELLPDLDAVAAWVAGAGVRTAVDPGKVPPAERDETVAFVHMLRGAIRTALESDAWDGRSLTALNQVLGEDPGVLRIEPDVDDPITLRGDSAGAQLRLDIASAVVDIFRHDRSRLGRCSNPDCVLLFLDVSKSGRRRWCDMTTCGNRAKVAAHYARTSHEPPPDRRDRRA